VRKFVSSGFYAWPFSNKKPNIAGKAQMKTIPTILIKVLMMSMRINRGKLSNIKDIVDFALSI
jgi:hypothetical protein